MTEYIECLLNGRFPLIVPDFRAEFWNERPDWHRGWMESLAERLQPGMIVVEAGSEHGDITAFMRQLVGNAGDVIPIEPAVWYWEYIRGTFQANRFDPPQVSFVGLVGDKSIEGRALDDGWPPEADTAGVPDGGFIHLRHASKEYAQTTIDDIASQVVPDAIVLDIEGAELLALQGAKSVLGYNQPLVFVSVHDIGDGAGWPGAAQGWYQTSVEDIHRFMGDLDYVGEQLSHHGEGEHFWYYQPK